MSRRILHVVDPAPGPGGGRGVLASGRAPDIATLACAAAIDAKPGDRHVVLVLGDRALTTHARALGLAGTEVVRRSTPLGHAIGAARSIGAFVRSRQFELVQAWSNRAFAACRLGVRRDIPLAPPPNGAWPSFRVPSTDRATIRASLGLPDHTPLIGLLADPLGIADTRQFVYLVGILDVAEYPVAGLIDPRSAHLARARRFHAEAGVGWRMLVSETSLAASLGACDVGVVLSRAFGPAPSETERAWTRWAVLRAHAAGVPVVGASAWIPDGALPEKADGSDSLHRLPGELRVFIRRLTRLTQDRGALEALGAEARAKAEAFASRSRFEASLDAHWESVLDASRRVSRSGSQSPA